MKLVKGKQYKVTKEGARLQRRYPIGGSAYAYATRTLDVGDVITYEGQRYGGGSDDVDYDMFTARGSDGPGQFWPNNWGRCHTEFLVEEASE